MRKFRYRSILVAVATAATMLIAPASATAAGEGYVDADPGGQNDWGDEGPFGSGSYPTADAVGLWQTVLYFDGRLDASDIDCVFGPRTIGATRGWNNTVFGAGGQASYDNALRAGLAWADNYLTPAGTWSKNSEYELMRYKSPATTVPSRSDRIRILRHKSDHGLYRFLDGATGNSVAARYTSGASASRCG